MDVITFEQIKEYLCLQIYPEGFNKDQKKSLRKKCKKFKYDSETNHLFHSSKTKVKIWIFNIHVYKYKLLF